MVKVIRHTLGPVQANCYVLVDEDSNEAVVIDPGAEDRELNNTVDDLNVVMILLTHGHFDHIGGAAALKERTGADVLIHQLEGEWPTNPDLNGSKLFAQACPEPVTGPAPDRLLEDGDTLQWAGPSIACMHTPGHTPGGMSLFVSEENALFTGDTLMARGIGRTDLPQGSHPQLLSSIRDQLLSLSDHVVVFPGHGGRTTIGHERTRNPWLQGL